MFEPDTEIRYLTYDLTLIDNLPILQPNEFTNLLSLTLIDNPLITCADVNEFIYYHASIEMNHDLPNCSITGYSNSTSTCTERVAGSTEPKQSDDYTMTSDDVTHASTPSVGQDHDNKHLSVAEIFAISISVLLFIAAAVIIYVTLKYRSRCRPRITRSPLPILNPGYNSRHLSESEC